MFITQAEVDGNPVQNLLLKLLITSTLCTCPSFVMLRSNLVVV